MLPRFELPSGGGFPRPDSTGHGAICTLPTSSLMSPRSLCRWPRDLTNRDHADALIRRFYTREFADPLLGPIFLDVASERADLAPTPVAHRLLEQPPSPGRARQRFRHHPTPVQTHIEKRRDIL